jgi:hypothetical protein
MKISAPLLGTPKRAWHNYLLHCVFKICCWVQFSFFIHKRIIPAVKRVEFVSDRMSYIILRGRWCNVIILIVHAPTEYKIGDI